MSSAAPDRLALIETLKALAPQLIIWHHLAFYGPMSDVVAPQAAALFTWLASQARMAVQIFLVVGGFLAARALMPQPGAPTPALSAGRLLWRRYLRLIRPLAGALVAAVLFAALARAWTSEASVPTAPTLTQLAVHLLLLQDVLGIDALSAGVWYVAIDFQLFALLLVLAHLGTRAGARVAIAIVLTLTAMSLVWWNRAPDLDEWGLYFFGAYGLGVAAYWTSIQPRREYWAAGLFGLLLLVAMALLIEWRDRILVAGTVALLLATNIGQGWQWPGALRSLIATLARISYSVFLIHYPVMLLVSALVTRYWPGQFGANAAGLIIAWLLSLMAGALLYHVAEAPPRRFAPAMRRDPRERVTGLY